MFPVGQRLYVSSFAAVAELERDTRKFLLRGAHPHAQVSKGLDKRTTIMIRNIPNKYTQAMLLQEIDASYRGAYDFFYLPIDFKNKCNVGYAFINFMDYRRIVPFFREFNGQRWKNFNSEKVTGAFYLP